MGIYIKGVGIPMKDLVHYVGSIDARGSTIFTMCNPNPQPIKGVNWSTFNMCYIGGGLKFTRKAQFVTCTKCLKSLDEEDYKSK